ncbi:MAG: DUF4412 domain-containing protein [Flavobacteriales bacterium]|jgi:hypothetical protein|nr:DUF4412 domain-containing protein [Flavobacteriales bacterium]
MKNITCLTVLVLVLTTSSLVAQSFTGSFDLVLEQIRENGNSLGDTLSYYFGKEKTALIIHAKGNQPDLRLVFNPADETITGLFEINDKKGGYELPMNDKYWPGMKYATRPYGTGPRKELQYTGTVKEIQGYTCREVLGKIEEYNARMWVAEDIPLTMTQVLGYQTVGAGESSKEVELFDKFGVEGLPLELYLESTQGKGTIFIQLVNFEKEFDAAVLSTDGHTFSKVD